MIAPNEIQSAVYKLFATEVYRALDDNFKKMGFERAENDRRNKLSWRWQTRTASLLVHRRRSLPGQRDSGQVAGRQRHREREDQARQFSQFYTHLFPLRSNAN